MTSEMDTDPAVQLTSSTETLVAANVLDLLDACSGSTSVHLGVKAWRLHLQGLTFGEAATDMDEALESVETSVRLVLELVKEFSGNCSPYPAFPNDEVDR